MMMFATAHDDVLATSPATETGDDDEISLGDVSLSKAEEPASRRSSNTNPMDGSLNVSVSARAALFEQQGTVVTKPLEPRRKSSKTDIMDRSMNLTELISTFEDFLEEDKKPSPSVKITDSQRADDKADDTPRQSFMRRASMSLGSGVQLELTRRKSQRHLLAKELGDADYSSSSSDDESIDLRSTLVKFGIDRSFRRSTKDESSSSLQLDDPIHQNVIETMAVSLTLDASFQSSFRSDGGGSSRLNAMRRPQKSKTEETPGNDDNVTQPQGETSEPEESNRVEKEDKTHTQTKPIVNAVVGEHCAQPQQSGGKDAEPMQKYCLEAEENAIMEPDRNESEPISVPVKQPVGELSPEPLDTIPPTSSSKAAAEKRERKMQKKVSKRNLMDKSKEEKAKDRRSLLSKGTSKKKLDQVTSGVEESGYERKSRRNLLEKYSTRESKRNLLKKSTSQRCLDSDKFERKSKRDLMKEADSYLKDLESEQYERKSKRNLMEKSSSRRDLDSETYERRSKRDLLKNSSPQKTLEVNAYDRKSKRDLLKKSERKSKRDLLKKADSYLKDPESEDYERRSKRNLLKKSSSRKNLESDFLDLQSSNTKRNSRRKEGSREGDKLVKASNTGDHLEKSKPDKRTSLKLSTSKQALGEDAESKQEKKRGSSKTALDDSVHSREQLLHAFAAMKVTINQQQDDSLKTEQDKCKAELKDFLAALKVKADRKKSKAAQKAKEKAATKNKQPSTRRRKSIGSTDNASVEDWDANSPQQVSPVTDKDILKYCSKEVLKFMNMKYPSLLDRTA